MRLLVSDSPVSGGWSASIHGCVFACRWCSVRITATPGLYLLVLLVVAGTPHLVVKGLMEATQSWLRSSTGSTCDEARELPQVLEVQLDCQPKLHFQEGMKQRRRAVTDVASAQDQS
jgi:hypothetical protein